MFLTCRSTGLPVWQRRRGICEGTRSWNTAPEGRLRSLVAWFRAMDTRRGFGLAAAMASIFLAFALLWEPSGTPGISGSVTAAREFSAQQAESALEDLRLLDELYGVPVVEEHQGKKI